jgi:hypothetical protein
MTEERPGDAQEIALHVKLVGTLGVARCGGCGFVLHTVAGEL